MSNKSKNKKQDTQNNIGSNKDSVIIILGSILQKYDIYFLRKVKNKYYVNMWDKAELCQGDIYDDIRVSGNSLLECLSEIKSKFL
ncbi:MAG: hypothetical protein EPN82_05675 [Bacteroidetes bacterium]|nr:MAG: hypothetical protein EPN82_05675 [Bacteroidota bacterium]